MSERPPWPSMSDPTHPRHHHHDSNVSKQDRRYVVTRGVRTQREGDLVWHWPGEVLYGPAPYADAVSFLTRTASAVTRIERRDLRLMEATDP